jgi:hypothetical protein
MTYTVLLFWCTTDQNKLFLVVFRQKWLTMTKAVLLFWCAAGLSPFATQDPWYVIDNNKSVAWLVSDKWIKVVNKNDFCHPWYRMQLSFAASVKFYSYLFTLFFISYYLYLFYIIWAIRPESFYLSHLSRQVRTLLYLHSVIWFYSNIIITYFL